MSQPEMARATMFQLSKYLGIVLDGRFAIIVLY